MSLVDDVQSELQARAIVDGSSEWPSTRRYLHDGTDRLVVFTEDGGFEPETPSFEGIGDSAMEEPAVQIRVRGNRRNGDEAREKMQEIMDALHGRQRETLGSTYYDRIKAQSGIIYIGMDERERHGFTLSFRARKPIALVS